MPGLAEVPESPNSNALPMPITISHEHSRDHSEEEKILQKKSDECDASIGSNDMKQDKSSSSSSSPAHSNQVSPNRFHSNSANADSGGTKSPLPENSQTSNGESETYIPGSVPDAPVTKNVYISQKKNVGFQMRDSRLLPDFDISPPKASASMGAIPKPSSLMQHGRFSLKQPPIHPDFETDDNRNKSRRSLGVKRTSFAAGQADAEEDQFQRKRRVSGVFMQLPSDLGDASHAGMDGKNSEYQKRKSLKQVKTRADNHSVSSISAMSERSVSFQKSKTLDEKTVNAKGGNPFGSPFRRRASHGSSANTATNKKDAFHLSNLMESYALQQVGLMAPEASKTVEKKRRQTRTGALDLKGDDRDGSTDDFSGVLIQQPSSEYDLSLLGSDSFAIESLKSQSVSWDEGVERKQRSFLSTTSDGGLGLLSRMDVFSMQRTVVNILALPNGGQQEGNWALAHLVPDDGPMWLLDMLGRCLGVLPVIDSPGLLGSVLNLCYYLFWIFAVWSNLIASVYFLSIKKDGFILEIIWVLYALYGIVAQVLLKKLYRKGSLYTVGMYAERCNFICTWVSDMKLSFKSLLLVLVPMACFTIWDLVYHRPLQIAGDHTWAWAFGVLGITAAQLTIFMFFLMISLFVGFSSLALDSFVLEFLTALQIDGITGKFNVCNAVMRQASYAVQSSLVFSFLFSTVSLILLGWNVWELSNDNENNLSVDAAFAWITHGVGQMGLSTGLLFWIMNQISVVNVKCNRLPAMFSTLNFGIEIDHDRAVVVNHISTSDMGFFIYNNRITRIEVFKLLYFVFCIIFVLLTKAIGVNTGTELTNGDVSAGVE